MTIAGMAARDGDHAHTIQVGGQVGGQVWNQVQFVPVRVGAAPVNGGRQDHTGVIVPAGVTIPATIQISTVRAIAGVQGDHGKRQLLTA